MSGLKKPINWEAFDYSDYEDVIYKLWGDIEEHLDGLEFSAPNKNDRILLKDCYKAIDYLLEVSAAMQLEIDSLTNAVERMERENNEHQSG